MSDKHYCWICESYNCDSKEHLMLHKKADETKHKNAIWKYFRENEYCKDKNGDIRLFNGGMSTDCLDRPICFNCGIFGYEIYLWSGKPLCEIYKLKWADNGNTVNLHHYWYVSENIPHKIFENDFREKITQEQLCKLVNRNWSKSKNFQKHIGNALFLKEMKKHLIKCLEKEKQIKYSVSQNKYIPYSYYLYCEENGWKW